MQPHDHLFHAVFAEPRHAAALLRTALPRAVGAAVDWDALQEVSNTLLDRDLATRHADLLFATQRRTGGEVIFLLEHKSKPEPFAVLQVLRYAVLIWQRCLDSREITALPLVIPVLVHHDRRPWQVPTNLARALDLRAHERALAPTFAITLVDLAGRSERAIRGLALPPMATLCLLHLTFARWMSPDEFEAAAHRWTDLYRATAATSGVEALQVFHSYAIWVTETPRQQLADCMARILGPEAGAHIMSTADKLIAEGKAEGRTEGRAEMLAHLLKKRFGRVADAHTARLRGASIAELDRWALRLLDARTIDEVFAD